MKKPYGIGVWVALAVIAVPVTVSAAPIASGPTDCDSSFNPYDYTSAAVNACGYRTFDRAGTESLPDGGVAYDYDLNGGGTVRFYIPPSGFDPMAASDAQLQEYGLPSRPADAVGLQRWQSEMSNWKGAASPPPFLAETNATADTVYAPTWSGYGVTGSSGEFTHAEAWYGEPQFYSSRCTSNAEVTWAGVGGYYDNNPLGQDGTSHNVPGLANHQAWWEIYPNTNVIGVNFFGSVGYLFDASTRRITGGYRFYMYNYYTAQTDAFDVTGGIYNIYDGSSAEAIAERPIIGGTPSNLSNFETMTFTDTRANDVALDSYSPTGGRHGIHMLNPNDGTILADPSGMTSGTDGYFTDTQQSCN